MVKIFSLGQQHPVKEQEQKVREAVYGVLRSGIWFNCSSVTGADSSFTHCHLEFVKQSVNNSFCLGKLSAVKNSSCFSNVKELVFGLSSFVFPTVAMECVARFHSNLYRLCFGKALGCTIGRAWNETKSSAEWGPGQSSEFRLKLHKGKWSIRMKLPWKGGEKRVGLGGYFTGGGGACPCQSFVEHHLWKVTCEKSGLCSS